MCVLCAVKRHTTALVVDVQKTIVLNAWIHTIVGTDTFIKHNKYHVFCTT